MRVTRLNLKGGGKALESHTVEAYMQGQVAPMKESD
jgi:hypothetical protein